MNVLAYIDPGVGSFVLQLVVGALVAVVVAFRKSRNGLARLVRWTSGRPRSTPEEESHPRS